MLRQWQLCSYWISLIRLQNKLSSQLVQQSKAHYMWVFFGLYNCSHRQRATGVLETMSMTPQPVVSPALCLKQALKPLVVNPF
jgi:hypothetical protein